MDCFHTLATVSYNHFSTRSFHRLTRTTGEICQTKRQSPASHAVSDGCPQGPAIPYYEQQRASTHYVAATPDCDKTLVDPIPEGRTFSITFVPAT